MNNVVNSLRGEIKIKQQATAGERCSRGKRASNTGHIFPGLANPRNLLGKRDAKLRYEMGARQGRDEKGILGSGNCPWEGS